MLRRVILVLLVWCLWGATASAAIETVWYGEVNRIGAEMGLVVPPHSLYLVESSDTYWGAVTAVEADGVIQSLAANLWQEYPDDDIQAHVIAHEAGHLLMVYHYHDYSEFAANVVAMCYGDYGGLAHNKLYGRIGPNREVYRRAYCSQFTNGVLPNIPLGPVR